MKNKLKDNYKIFSCFLLLTFRLSCIRCWRFEEGLFVFGIYTANGMGDRFR
jgi:hypothetical protein